MRARNSASIAERSQGESRVEKVSDRRAYQPGERTVDEQDRGGYYASQARSAYGGRTGGHAQDTGRMSSCAQEAGAMNGYAQETGRMGSYAEILRMRSNRPQNFVEMRLMKLIQVKYLIPRSSALQGSRKEIRTRNTRRKRKIAAKGTES